MAVEMKDDVWGVYLLVKVMGNDGSSLANASKTSGIRPRCMTQFVNSTIYCTISYFR